MSENLEGPWLFEFVDGQSIHFAVHEAVEDRDECIDLIETNHGKVTENLEDADFVLFSHQTHGIEELLQDGMAQGKPAVDVNWIHRCRGAERIVPWYSFQIGTRDLALTKLSAEARDEHEIVVFMARYGPILTLKQSFEKLERMFPHRSARKFRDLYTQKSSRLTPQITSLQQRLENVFKSPLRLVPTKPRLNFSRSAPRLASTFDIHSNTIESLDFSQSWEDTRAQTPPPASVPLTASMTSHYPSSSPSSRPVHQLPPDDNTRSLGNISRATEHPQIPTENAFGDINNHKRAVAETNTHSTLHAGSIALESRQVTGPELSVAIRPSGPLEVDSSQDQNSAEDAHWAAAVEFTAMRESSWTGLAHWKDFIAWYEFGNVRTAVAWQSWFKRRRTKFVKDVVVARTKRGLGASAQLDNGETSRTRSHGTATNERVDNDGDEDVNAIVEYLLTTPLKSDESITAYWEGFQTSYRNGKSRTAKEWSSYYSRNFQISIRPKVEKRARELKVDVVLRINDKEIRIPGNPVEVQGLQVSNEVADYFTRVEQGMAPRRQENASSISQTQRESPYDRRSESPTKGDLSTFGVPMTFGGPYTLEEDVAIALYQETHPYDKWTRAEYWNIFSEWFPRANRPANTYANAERRRRDLLTTMRRKVREARARGIGTSGYPEEMVKSLVTALKRKRGDDDDDDDDEDDEDVKEESEEPYPTSKRRRTMVHIPKEDQTPATDNDQSSRMSQSSETGDPDTLSSLSSSGSNPHS